LAGFLGRPLAGDSLAHAHARAVACLRELDLVHEREHERNAPASFRERPLPGRLDEPAAIGHLNLDDAVAPFENDLDCVPAARLLDRVAERLRRRQLDVEALFRTQAKTIREGVDGPPELGRRARPASETEFDARLFLDVTNTLSVPIGVPNGVNG
jgi:hypothetical protein